MKPFLLLIAVYSLIINQSNKNAKEKEMAGKKDLAKEIPIQTDSYNKQIASPIFTFGNTGDMSRRNIYFKWSGNE